MYVSTVDMCAARQAWKKKIANSWRRICNREYNMYIGIASSLFYSERDVTIILNNIFLK